MLTHREQMLRIYLAGGPLAEEAREWLEIDDEEAELASAIEDVLTDVEAGLVDYATALYLIAAAIGYDMALPQSQASS